MEEEKKATTEAFAGAAFAIVEGILELLCRKNVVSTPEVAAMLRDMQRRVAGHRVTTIHNVAAARVIGHLAARFPTDPG